MDKSDWLARAFQENRDHLRAVAYRMLGSSHEADDALQEAWLRLTRSEADGIANLGGWLTTVVARICLDTLRSRKSRREEALAPGFADGAPDPAQAGPDAEVLLAEAVGPALLLVLDTLTPAERVAFVLHDLFELSFEEIAPVLDRSEAAARQLASRARRRVRGKAEPAPADAARQREIVTAFMAASRGGDFAALLELLDPDVVLRADSTAVHVAAANKARGAPAFEPELRGARVVADTLKGRAVGAQLALIDGLAGAAWGPDGTPRVVFAFAVRGERIVEINVIMDRKHLNELEVEPLDDPANPLSQAKG